MSQGYGRLPLWGCSPTAVVSFNGGPNAGPVTQLENLGLKCQPQKDAAESSEGRGPCVDGLAQLTEVSRAFLEV